LDENYFHEHFYKTKPKITLNGLAKTVLDSGDFIESYPFDSELEKSSAM
jgi:hypothetical protein